MTATTIAAAMYWANEQMYFEPLASTLLRTHIESSAQHTEQTTTPSVRMCAQYDCTYACTSPYNATLDDTPHREGIECRIKR